MFSPSGVPAFLLWFNDHGASSCSLASLLPRPERSPDPNLWCHLGSFQKQAVGEALQEQES